MGIGFDSGWYSKAPRGDVFQKPEASRAAHEAPARVVLGGFAKRDCKVVDIAVPGLLSVVQLSCPAHSALHSHRAPGPANLFGETGPWLA